MRRLIDATEVVKNIIAERDKIPRTVPAAPYEVVTEKPYHGGNQMRGGIRKALRCIEQAPTVDAVEVARCKDCKRAYHDPYSGCYYCHERQVQSTHFCSYGERKEGAD